MFKVFYKNNLNCFVKCVTRQCSTGENLILYGDTVSPPVRFVMMTASMLNVKLNFYNIDLFKSENKLPFYKKINPLQKVPALQVGQTIICDSHAIALYLCENSNDPVLYPKDPLTRAKINQMLHFDSGTLFPIDSSVFTEYFRGKKTVDEMKIHKWYSALDYLEHQLSNDSWLSSDKISLSDLCCVCTVSSLQLLVPLLDRHVKIKNWMSKLQELPCYEINSSGLERFRNLIDMV